MKTLSFKVKTVILDQMFDFINILMPSPRKIKKLILKKMLKDYSNYAKILNIFDNAFENV
jgi:hypothetical protein